MQDTGTGDLKLRASITRLMGTTDSDNQGVFTQGGGVELYYDNSKKLGVVTGGVDVTGALTATGNVSGSATSTGSFGQGFIANKLGIGTTAPAGVLHTYFNGDSNVIFETPNYHLRYCLLSDFELHPNLLNNHHVILHFLLHEVVAMELQSRCRHCLNLVL